MLSHWIELKSNHTFSAVEISVRGGEQGAVLVVGDREALTLRPDTVYTRLLVGPTMHARLYIPDGAEVTCFRAYFDAPAEAL